MSASTGGGGGLSRNKAGVFSASSSSDLPGPVTPQAQLPTSPTDYALAKSLSNGRAPSFNRMGKSPSLMFAISSQTESSFKDAADEYNRSGSGSSGSLKTPLRHFRKSSMRSDPMLTDGGSSLMSMQKRLKMHARKAIRMPPNAAIPLDTHEIPENASKIIQGLTPGTDVRCFVPVKSMSHPSPESSPVEYLVVAVKPFKNKAKMLLLRGTVYNLSIEHRWKLGDLTEFNELAPITVSSYLESMHNGTFNKSIFGGTMTAENGEDGSEGEGDESPAPAASASVSQTGISTKIRMSQSTSFDNMVDDTGSITLYPFFLKFGEKRPHVFGMRSRDARRSFLTKLLNICQALLRVQPRTKLEYVMLNGDGSKSKGDGDKADGGEKADGSGEDDDDDDYEGEGRLMSREDENEILQLMGGSNVSSDFDTVYKLLSDRLEELESRNVMLLLNAQPPVRAQLLPTVNGIEGQLRGMDDWLSTFDVPLRNARHYIQHIEERNNRMETVTKNQRVLLSTLNSLVTQLSFDDARRILTNYDLAKPEHLEDIIKSANKVKEIVTAKFDQSIMQLAAVQEQLASCRKTVKMFSDKLQTFLLNMIQDMKEMKDKHQKRAGLEIITNFHSKLDKYVPLIMWLNVVSPAGHTAVLGQYVKSFDDIYKRAMRWYFDELHGRIVKEPRTHQEMLNDILFTDSSKKLSDDWLARVKAGTSEAAAPAEKEKEKEKDKTGNKLTVDKACMTACRDVLGTITKEVQWFCKAFEMTERGFSDLIETKQIRIFGGEFREKLKSLINTAFSADPFYMLESLSSIEAATQAATSSASSDGSSPIFIVEREASLIEQECKQLFNTFIDQQAELLQHTTVAIRGVTVAPNIFKLPYFLKFMDNARKSKASGAPDLTDSKRGASMSSLTSLIDFACAKLMTAFMNVIQEVPATNGVTMCLVARAMNLNHVVTSMRTHKHLCETYPSLALNVEQTNQAYKTTLNKLSVHMVAKNFEKLITFFSRVKEMTMTTAADEVKFTAKFSKQEALRVVREYGPATMEKSLARIIHSFSKKLSSSNRYPDGIMSVFWREFSALFTQKYTSVETLMKECYGATLPVPLSMLETLLASVWEVYVQQHAGSGPGGADEDDTSDIEM